MILYLLTQFIEQTPVRWQKISGKRWRIFMAQTKSDYDFLSKLCGISNQKEFKDRTEELIKTVDLKRKQKDFEHLLFNNVNSEKILHFGAFIRS